MRRANLDAFWSRESLTVRSKLGEAMQTERRAFRLGMPSMTPPMGPWPLEDSQGMSAALAVLDRSLDKGKYAVGYIQKINVGHNQYLSSFCWRIGELSCSL
jgi:hypothetical protein